MMFTKERYYAIINMIETIVNCGIYEDAGSIASNVANTAGLGVRELSNIFSFLTGKSLNEYIKIRQMNKSYFNLIHSEGNECQLAIGCTGYKDQSSYIKKFKQLYHSTPQEALAAYRGLNVNLNIRPLFWEMLNIEDEDRKGEMCDLNCYIGDKKKCEDTIQSEEGECHVDKIYGIDPEEFQLMMAVEAYRIEHDFTKLQANAAFEVIKTFEGDMAEAFEFIESYEVDMEIEYEEGEEAIKNIDYVFFAYFLIYLYNVGGKHNMDTLEVYNVCRELSEYGINPEDIETEDIDYYFENRTEIAYFIPNYIDAKYGYKEIKGKYEDLTFYDFHGIVCEAGIENAFDIVDMDYERKESYEFK